MGNALGSAFPAAEIAAICTEALAVFGIQFARYYLVGLMKEKIKEAEAAGEGYRLLKYEPGLEPILSGLITKQGAIRKNWKTRFFVLFWGKVGYYDQYRLRYYVNEEAYKENPDKFKGEIQLCGKRIEAASNPEEKANLGEFGIKIVPRWSSRYRTYYLRFADAEDQNKWMSSLENAAWRASAPVNPDPVVRYAFEKGFDRTRWKVGGSWWWWLYTSEQEALAEWLVDRCNNQCMWRVYDKLPSGAAGNILRNKMTGALDATVGSAVQSAYIAALNSLQENKDSLKAKVSGQMDAVVNAQESVKARVSDAVTPKVAPVLRKVAEPVVGPISSVMTTTLASAMKALVEEVWKPSMSKILSDVDAAAPDAQAEVLRESIEKFRRSLYWYSGPLRPAYEKAWALTRNSNGASFGRLSLTLSEIVSLLNNATPRTLEMLVEEACEEVLQAAVHTLKTRISEDAASFSQRAEIFKVVTADLIHDCQLYSLLAMRKLYKPTLMEPINKDVMPTLNAVLEPLADVVPDALKDFLDVQEFAQDLVDSTFSDIVDQMCLPDVRSAFDGFQGLGPEGVEIPAFRA